MKLVSVSLESGVFVVGRTFSLQISSLENGSYCRSLTQSRGEWNWEKCGFTGTFDLFWLKSARLKRDSLCRRLECSRFWLWYTFARSRCCRSLSRACGTGLGLFSLCPLTFLLQLVITPHQPNLCSIGFWDIRGKGIWKLSNVVVMPKVRDYRIHLVSLNPETKFSFVFSWGKRP